MTDHLPDGELDRMIRAARPHTGADDGWAVSDDGAHSMAAIRRRAATLRHAPLRVGRRLSLGVGLAAAVAVAVALGMLGTGNSAAPDRPVAIPTVPSGPAHLGPGGSPQQMALVAYTNCDAMLASLRSHLAAHIGPYGFGGYGGGIRYPMAAGSLAGAPNVDQAAGSGPGSVSAPAAPGHSTTNVQETGVGEPDIVETDGRRIVSVSDGVLRVVDVATHQVTGTLDLNEYAGAGAAQLLMSGDRVLVLMGNQVTYYPYYRGPMIAGGLAYPYQPATGGSTFLLVDLAQGQPRIVDTLHTSGGYVDARMVGHTARLVVQSTPKLTFPYPANPGSNSERAARNRDVVNSAPLSAWLPTYQTNSAAGGVATHTVPCERVSHPAHYTGASMLTVFTADLAGNLTDPQPISLAADGTAVYASTSSLYVVSSNGVRTQLHRFDISAPGRPRYLGSGTVPGYLLDAYSMSEYQGALRVVTSSYSAQSATALYTLNAATLHVLGHVGGLGRGERLHAVRFLGPLAYVVTFESVDPLYVLDLHDPAHPRRAGELTITGYSDYLHPVAPGRVLGVGESVNSSQVVTGLQVSLFDVDAPAHPKRVAKIVRSHTPSETPIDPHAFLYWPATGTAVVPIDSWDPGQSGAALVLHVDTDGLQVRGTIRNPAVSSAGSYDTGIERTLVIGNDIWTMSSSGLQASDLHSLAHRAWVAFA